MLIRALPVLLRERDPAQFLVSLLDDLAAGAIPLIREREVRLMVTVCKRAAIKAGQALSLEEMRELIQKLEQSEIPYTCPHGRPTILHFSWARLEQEFGRR